MLVPRVAFDLLLASSFVAKDVVTSEVFAFSAKASNTAFCDGAEVVIASVMPSTTLASA